MSADGKIVRGIYRFANWALTPAPDEPARYVAKCLTCGRRSMKTEDADEAQLWCLKHAGATRHSDFELSASRRYEATT
jgi:hypothetical protein